jgi:hypothetical protein
LCERVSYSGHTSDTFKTNIYVYVFCVDHFEYFDFPQTDGRNQNIQRAPHRKHTHIFASESVSSVSEIVMRHVALLAQIHSYL